MASTRIPGTPESIPPTSCRLKLLGAFLGAITVLLCSSQPGLAASSPALKIAVNPWMASALDAELARILLQEKLGYQVELVAIDETPQFPALGNGDLDATLEIWPSAHVEDHLVFVEQQKTVEDIGPLGVTGQIGWFIPNYLLQREPTLNTWQGIKAHADLFKTANSGTAGQLLEGDPSWAYRDKAIISSLGLALSIVQAGSEAALISAVSAAYQRQDAVLFYFWTPHPLLAKYQLTEVQLPPDSPSCPGCGYPTEILYKAVSAGLSQKAPAAYRLLQSFTLSNSDQITMMGEVQDQGATLEAAARHWLAQNQSKWSAWFGDPTGALPAIPAAANPWAAHYLFVLDKDTNSVFMNANDLYVSSLTPNFPAIKTVSDLKGHDDFYVYPTDLAVQFRADDRKVMAAGLPLTRVEVNEPIGGLRTIVHVTKVPLRDETNRIVGLRAIWHSQPVLDLHKSPGGLAVSLPDDASDFEFETNSSVSNPDGWGRLKLAVSSGNGKRTIETPAANTRAFFRAALDRPVQIGALLSLTDNATDAGGNLKAALEIGVEAANLEELSSGSGLHFSADIRDTKLDPTTALAALQSLATNGIRLVIGPETSAELAVLKPIADANGILLISPSSTASSLAIPGDNIVRFCPDDSYEAAATAALMAADGVEAVVPIWRDDAGNQGLHNSLLRVFTNSNRVVYAGVKYAPNETQFAPAVSALSAQVATALLEHPGKVAVYMAGFEEAILVFHLASDNATLQSVRWYGTDDLTQSQALASDHAAAEFAANHSFPCPTLGLDERFAAIWKPLSTSIRLRSGRDVDNFTLAGYDAFRVAVLAYRQINPDSSFSDLKAAFLKAAASYVGATGPTVLNAADDRAGGAFDFWSLKADGAGYSWYRSASFVPDTAGGGTIKRF